MTVLELPADFPLKAMITELADADTMFDGRPEHYLGVGLSALHLIEGAFEGDGEPARILDLPCGFGRITRILRARYPDAALTVSDLDHAATAYTAARFDARGVPGRRDTRNVDLGGTFDLIWVGSLLTHLSEQLVREFLDFAARHMDERTRLVVTTHGQYVATRLRSSTYGLSEAAACGLLADHRMHGCGFRGYSGDQHYGISLASRLWFEELVSGTALALQSYHPRGWDRHQDALVLRRRPVAGWPRRLIGGLLRRGETRPVQPFDAPGSSSPPLGAAAQAALDASSVNGFDEGWYLAKYPDVADAVGSGAWPSGLAHFQAFGWKEARLFCDPALTYEGRTATPVSAYLGNGGGSHDAKVNEAWSGDPAGEAEDHGWYWMAHPSVRARVNRLVSGNESDDAYQRLAAFLRERGASLPIRHAVSLGCGFGDLERDLCTRGLVHDMDAYDLARGAIAEADRRAKQLGLARLRFHVADLEAIRLPPGSVDVVFAHSSVHHVERLEPLYDVVRRALRPDGLFHLNEFIGPTRFQWTDAQLELANAFLDKLPERLRRLPSGQPKERLRRPTIDEMIAADPSEAVRSADLVAALDRCFEILEMRPTGGALLHLALGGIAQNFDPASNDDQAILHGLFDTEDRAMSDGVIGSDFAVLIASPKAARGEVLARS